MARYFYSLQFRLVLGFTVVLAMALAGVSAYVGYAADREVERFQRQQDDSRTERVQRVINQFYNSRERGNAAQLQALLEQAGRISNRRIIVQGRNGEVVGDSHLQLGGTSVPASSRCRCAPGAGGQPAGGLICRHQGPSGRSQRPGGRRTGGGQPGLSG